MPNDGRIKIRRALISVSDKTGLEQLAQDLHALEIEIISTGGTLTAIQAADVPAIGISDYTGSPEILNGRVKTLHPKVHAGILYKRDNDDHVGELTLVNANSIDLVIVNLYPFQQTVATPGAKRDEIIENIDIGGPTLIRGAAKNADFVTVVTSPTDYAELVRQLQENDCTTDLEFRQNCAQKAFFMTAVYDIAIAEYLGNGRYAGFIGELVRKHRYGENPYQFPSGLYTLHSDDPLALNQFTQAEGGDPGYVNDTDLDRLLQTLTHIAATFKENGRKFRYYAVGVKHGNACGASFGNDKLTVLRNMIRGNPRAIWGGMIITNFTINAAEARILRMYMVNKKKRILDGVFAPKITSEAIAILKRPKGACKMLVNPALSTPELDTARWFRRVRGGFLLQPNFTYIFRFDNKSVERFGKLSRAQKDNLLLAAAICQTSNSNTTTLVMRRMLIGNGMTRPDRCDATTLSVTNAREQGHDPEGAVAVTDSFFPFDDGPRVLIKAGISAILTVFGSLGDAIVKKTITEAGITLIWLPVYEGRMFFGH